MYLPNSIYERAPHYWLLIGLLLVILGVYLGIQMNSKFLVVGVLLGLASCAWGLRVLLRRSRRPGEVDVASSPVSSD
jgi:tetrahydromethanopterin S-methyltransferase subunit C